MQDNGCLDCVGQEKSEGVADRAAAEVTNRAAEVAADRVAQWQPTEQQKWQPDKQKSGSERLQRITKKIKKDVDRKEDGW